VFLISKSKLPFFCTFFILYIIVYIFSEVTRRRGPTNDHPCDVAKIQMLCCIKINQNKAYKAINMCWYLFMIYVADMVHKHKNKIK